VGQEVRTEAQVHGDLVIINGWSAEQERNKEGDQRTTGARPRRASVFVLAIREQMLDDLQWGQEEEPTASTPAVGYRCAMRPHHSYFWQLTWQPEPNLRPPS
jgi:hypothetical protein